MNTKIHNVIFLGLSFLLLIGEWGCAHQAIAPSPLPESMQQQLGKIGVVIRSTEEQKTLGTPGTGRLSNIGRGAGLGAAMGAGACAQGGGLGAIFCLPALATLGLVGGAFYGAVASEPWQVPEATFRTIVAELNLNRTLPEHLAAFSRLHGYEIAHLSTGPSEETQEPSRYAAARRDGIDTVLEIQDLTVNLIPAEYSVNPHRELILSARAQLIRTADATVLDDRVVTDKFGPALVLNEWTADHAARFRQEAQQASDRLAEQIVSDYFMVYPFFERVTSGFFLAVHLKGLRPLYPGEEPGLPGRGISEEDIRAKYSRGEFRDSVSWPIPNEFRIMAQRADALQPTMSWEPFSDPHVTYELKIWRSGRLGPDALVYSRSNIEQVSHKLETALEPSSLYYWSVRAHFVEHGKDRITEWSRRSVKPSLMAKIMTSGIAALMPDPVDEGFYVFITPPPRSQSPKPAAYQTKWFPWGNWPLSPPDSERQEQSTR